CRSNALASRLNKMGVQPGDFVAVCLGRSFDLIIALLAVLKAGAAYVPLDPEYPSSRLNHILTDSKAALVLTCGKYSSRLGLGTRTVCLDEQLDFQTGL